MKGNWYTEYLQVQTIQFTILLDIIYNADMAGIMKMPLKLTAKLENLKQRTAEMEQLKTQAENDRSTIQVLQNGVFLLEVELFKLPSSKEFFTCLGGMHQLTHS